MGSFFNALAGSEVNIRGGYLRDSNRAFSGSEVNIVGGSVRGSLRALVGSEVNISGGNVGQYFQAYSGSDVELVGGEFRLNGNDYLGSIISLNEGDVFTGTLADGSAFIFSDWRDTLDVVTLAAQSTPLAPADLTPRLVSTAGVGDPSGLRAGQTLTVQEDGVLGYNFAVVGATLNVGGGSVGSGMELSEGQFNMSGGSVDGGLDIYPDSEVNISGGSVRDTVVIYSGSEINISGGSLGSSLDIRSGSVVNISGGNWEDHHLYASDDSEINLFGTEFFLGGVPMTGLTLGEAYTVSERGLTISGVLQDASTFSISNFNGRGGPTISYDATLTVTLVYGPALPGDYDGDGFVSQADLDLVLINWGVGTLPDGFDTAALGGGGVFDGLLSQNELDGVLLNWGNGTPPAGGLSAIPEPGTLALIALGAAGLLRRSRALG